MTQIADFLNAGVNFIHNAGAITTSITKYNYVAARDDEYDDEVQEVITGSVSFSGLLFPLNTASSSSDILLLEQGKLKTTDKILYCGSIGVDESKNKFLIGSQYYAIVPNGVQHYEVAGSTVYSKIYVRNTRQSSNELF